MSSHPVTKGTPTGPLAVPTTRPATKFEQRVDRRGMRRTRTVQRPSWEFRYAAAVVGVDIGAVLIAAAISLLAGLGRPMSDFGILSQTTELVVALLVLCSLFLTRAWEPAVLGQGSEEFSRLIRAVVSAAVVLGLVGLAIDAEFVRPWVFGLIPLTGAVAALGRWVLRKELHRRRMSGSCVHAMLAVGDVDAVADLISRTRRDRFNGWVVTGVCTPTGRGPDGSTDVLGVPVVGDLDAVSKVVQAGQHRVVSVSASPGWSPRRLHQLAWDLEDVGADLVVDPGLMEVAGPRLHVAPVDGLPLLRLTEPTFSGVPRVVKYLVDRIGALLLLLLLAPLMIGTAAAVCLDGGPAFFRQTRVGRDGSPFKMIKFRSMVVGADRMVDDLSGVNDGSGPLFKMRQDPRVTRVGAWLRRYSIDELPQLLNVVTGTMSLVGPRPPLPKEVATYSRDAHRKFLVKPGLTGLWQVSGRSDLSWEESVRLDLRYVENWTLAQDALILWKTIGAVTRRSGAY